MHHHRFVNCFLQSNYFGMRLACVDWLDAACYLDAVCQSSVWGELRRRKCWGRRSSPLAGVPVCACLGKVVEASNGVWGNSLRGQPLMGFLVSLIAWNLTHASGMAGSSAVCQSWVLCSVRVCTLGFVRLFYTKSSLEKTRGKNLKVLGVLGSNLDWRTWAWQS